MRDQLAVKYFQGAGLEIGPLHNPTPLPPGASVIYVEHPEVDKNHPDVVRANLPNIIYDNAETLARTKDDSQDFLIANHVLEHCEDVIETLSNWCRVLKSMGKMMVALPDKDACFDRNRAVTPLEHIILDHQLGPKVSRVQHYLDWFLNSELEGKKPGVDIVNKVLSAVETNANIHWHCWDYPAMEELFRYVQDESLIDLQIVEVVRNGSEVIWILRKHS